jgi:hypothetical protein
MEQIGLKNPDSCALCGNASGIRKRTFFLYGGNLRKRVCIACILAAGSGAVIMQELERRFPKFEDGREARFKKSAEVAQ